MSKDTLDQTIQERLVPGENIVASARIHPGIYWQSAAVLFFAVLVYLFIVKELGFLLVAVALLMALYETIKKNILMLVVTNKRVLARYGILQVDVVDMHFDKIESIEMERMPPGYLMGYANVVLMGTGNRHIVIPYVANAAELRRAYNEQVLK
jgi:Bacterial membrane flanked domain.